MKKFEGDRGIVELKYGNHVYTLGTILTGDKDIDIRKIRNLAIAMERSYLDLHKEYIKDGKKKYDEL